jgi:L-asparaginase II
VTSLDSDPPSAAAIVTRGEGVDAWHYASVAVVDAAGKLSHVFGDPELTPLTRSSIKPFQALALLVSGAADAFGLDQRELAIACASHSGSDEHVGVVRGFLAKIGAEPSNLLCGAHLPIGLRVLERPPTAGEDKDPLYNNCSGKHAGFLAVARHLGVPLREYLERDSAVQLAVRARVALACGVDETTLPVGTDGCSAPNYALPLSALARGIGRLARPESAAPELGAPLSRIRDAMVAHPLLLSGEQRFDYDLMRAHAGNLVCKVGAEGLELVAVREPGLAFALKVHDGAERALAPLCLAVLDQLGVAASEPALLARYRATDIKNHRQIVTGKLRTTLKLRKI